MDVVTSSLKEMTLTNQDPQKEMARLEEARLEKVLLDTALQNVENQMKELKKQIEVKKKEKEQKEKEKGEVRKDMLELRKELDEALSGEAPADAQIRHLNFQLDSIASALKSTPSPPNKDELQEKQIALKREVSIAKGKLAMYRSRIDGRPSTHALVRDDYGQLIAECKYLDTECKSMELEYKRMEQESVELCTKLQNLLKVHPSLTADSSRQPNTNGRSNVRVFHFYLVDVLVLVLFRYMNFYLGDIFPG